MLPRMAQGPRGGPLYKILPETQWASAAEVVPQAAVDRADGFVHLSAAHQVRETAAKHFAGQSGLTLLEVDPARIPAGTLRWEVSRGGDHFPHVHGEIPMGAVVGVDALPDGADGFRFPTQVPQPLDADADADADAIATRLEQAECNVMLALARVAQKVLGDLAPAHRQIGPAIATSFGPSSPINCVKGLGVGSPFRAAQLDEAQAFFREVGAHAAVEVSDRADPAVAEALRARGYRLAQSECVLVCCLARAGTATQPGTSPAVLEPVATEDVPQWCRYVGLGFAGGGEGADEVSRYAGLSHAVGQGCSYWIVADGTRVGTCGLRFDHEVAMMLGSAVLEPYRRRGHHRAALEARLEIARRLGCRWAKLDAQADSSSRRNGERVGFTVSHTRAAWVHDHDA